MREKQRAFLIIEAAIVVLLCLKSSSSCQDRPLQRGRYRGNFALFFFNSRSFNFLKFKTDFIH